MIFFLIPLFAFLYRCRGGFLPLGNTQAARLLYWAIPIGITCGIISGWWVTGVACGALAFLSLLIPHGFAQNRGLSHYFDMALVGGLRMLIVLVGFWSLSVLPFAVIGMLSGIAYAIGWELLDGSEVRLFGQQFAQNGAEWGEVLTGAAYGIEFIMLSLFS